MISAKSILTMVRDRTRQELHRTYRVCVDDETLLDEHARRNAQIAVANARQKAAAFDAAAAEQNNTGDSTPATGSHSGAQSDADGSRPVTR